MTVRTSEEITRVLLAQGGAGSVRALVAAGFSRRTVEAMVRREELVRVRKDAVVLASALLDVSAWERDRLQARAVGLSVCPARPPAVTPAATEPAQAAALAVSHESALALHDLAWYGGDGLVHLVRTDGRRGHREGIVQVHCPVRPGWVEEVDGIRVVAPALAALQVAATHGIEAGVVALDGVLLRAEGQDEQATGRRHGPARMEVDRQVAQALAEGFGRGNPAAKVAKELADGLSASAGESRTRWLLHTLGFGPFTLQFPVRAGDVLLGLADIKLDRWAVLVEFDGALKYTDPAILVAEKDREDRLREQGYEVVRIRWADLGRPNLVRTRILAAIARAEARAATSA